MQVLRKCINLHRIADLTLRAGYPDSLTLRAESVSQDSVESDDSVGAQAAGTEMRDYRDGVLFPAVHRGLPTEWMADRRASAVSV